MNNFSYWAPTCYEFGRGAERSTGALASRFGFKNALVVYGHGSAVRSGLLDRVTASLTEAGINVTPMGGIDPNPGDDKVRAGIDTVRRLAIDSIVAVGGGSVIDTAKAIAAGARYDGDFWDFWAGKAVVADALPVGVVLTIPAAGSEGSGNSVITRLEDGRKISLRTDYWLRPKFAVLNPELTFTLPPYQTASGIADMMAHIMERYFTPTPDVEVTDRLAEGLLKAIITEAPKVMARPDDYEARANIMWSSTMAHNGVCGCGRAEDWVSHGMEHELSALYGVTHGAGLAVVFPAYITFMAAHAPQRPAQLARRVFGVDAVSNTEAALTGVRILKSFFVSLGLPVTLSGLGIDNPDFATLVERLHQNKGARFGAYMQLGPEQTEAIYRLML